jgi:hypothetical protein
MYKARDKFGAINLNHSVSKKWTLSGFAAYSSTFNQSITNSERGILNLLPQIYDRKQKNKTDSKTMHLLQNLVLSTKPMISFKWIMMRF